MCRIFSIMLISIFGLYHESQGQGNLLIAPTLVVFDVNKQKDEINLVNTGKDTANYSISFLHYNMKEDGSYQIIEKPDPGQMFAEPYLRIYPRQVTLAPGESQVIRVQWRRTSDMLAGEYRSHLYFRSENKTKPLALNDIDPKAFKVQLIPIFGISIPVIIRTGDINVSATLSDLRMENQKDTIGNFSFNINRFGNISIDGDIKIQFFPKQGKPIQIGIVNGVRVFTNINKRNIVVKLNTPKGTPLKNGKLKVTYSSNDVTKKTIVLAEEELDV